MHDTPVSRASGLLSIGVVKAVVDGHHDRRACHHQYFNRVQTLNYSGRWRRDHHVEAVEDLPAFVLSLLVLLLVAAE